jgi:glycerophosphoryl diester phosphodiesterase
MLRRAQHDPPFSPENLKVGLALGASMEIDIRLLADDAWICLHDDTLDDETNGTGPASAIDTAAARQLRIAGGGYAPPLLADIAAALPAAPRGALLQLDLKEDADGITDEAVASFASIVSPVAAHCVLSGDDWQAVRRLGAGVPDLRLGFDPYALAEGRTFEHASDFEAFVANVWRIAPRADAFYLYHAFVTAALAKGCNPVKTLKAGGAFVDVWTLDPAMPGVVDILEACTAAGADQITTNDPPRLARLWQARP